MLREYNMKQNHDPELLFVAATAILKRVGKDYHQIRTILVDEAKPLVVEAFPLALPLFRITDNYTCVTLPENYMMDPETYDHAAGLLKRGGMAQAARTRVLRQPS